MRTQFLKQKFLKLTGGLMAAAMLLAGCGMQTATDSGGTSGAGKDTNAGEQTAGGNGAGKENTDGEAGQEGETAIGSISYPLNSDKIISWYAEGGLNPHEKFVDASESPFHVGLSEQLGVDIEWVFPTTGANGGTFTTTLLADPGSLPNIMQVYWMNNANQYLSDEIIWDLTDYIQEYAPDYYAWLQSNPTYDRAMKTDAGQYYAFGFFREDGGWNDSYLGPVVRQDWLEECGLEIPTTISEFENVIKVFNEKYGATFNASNTRYREQGLAGAFDSNGNYALNNGWYVEDGKVGLSQAEEGWRAHVSWQNKLWEAGLMDQDILTEDDTTIKDKIHNDKCGISITSMGQMNNWNLEREAAGKEPVWIGIPNPTSDDGEIFSIFGGPGIGNHTVVITTTADEETMKLCLQMLNYAYTEEGSLYWNYGKEGVSWEYDAEGVPAFTALVTEDTDTDPMTKYNGLTWGACGIQATNLLYLKNSQAAIEANDTWYYVYPDDEAKNLAVTSEWKWPVGVTFTTEEADELDEIAQNLPTFVEESYAAFLTGSKDIDDDTVWNQYISDLESYSLSRILEIRQDCYDRYLAR